MVEAAADNRAPIERTAPDTIRLERTLDAPVETVWRYLTEAELRRDGSWAAPMRRPSGEFDLLIDHDNLSDDDVPYPENYAQVQRHGVDEKVIRFEPPRLLETTFQGGKNGTVTYELFPRRRADAAGADPQRHPERHRRAGFRQRLEFAPDRARGAAGGARGQGLLGTSRPLARGGGEGARLRVFAH